ncbi:MAG: PAS domain S-box protein [Bacteroidales bacterium]|nr:PAS domain S-box protein [Bacteroidales bacterium]
MFINKKTKEHNNIGELDIENYQLLFQYAPLGVFKATAKGRYIEVNPTLVKLLGYTNSEELINSIEDIGNQIYSDPELRKKIIRDLHKEKKIVQIETNFRKKSGEKFPVNLTLCCLHKTSGNDDEYILGMVDDITDKKAYLEKVLWERNYLRSLIDHIPDYIYFKNHTGKLTVANKAFAKLLNINDPKELERAIDNDFLSNELVVNFFKDDTRILKTGIPVLNDERAGYDDYNGKLLYTLFSKIPAKNQDGKVIGLIGIGRNITELKFAEQQISESQANLTALIESTKNSIWAIDKNYRLTTFNSYFKKFIHLFYDKELHIGDDIRKIIPRSQKDSWIKIFKQAFDGAQWVQEDCITKDGVNIFFEISINPIRNNKNEVTGVTVFSNNITERKIAEEALKESEERFRQLAENSNDVFILSNKYNILYVNPAFEKVFGRSTESAYRNYNILIDSFHPSDKKQFTKFFAKNTLAKSSDTGQQLKIIRPDDEERKVWIRNFPIYNDKGKIYRYVFVITDITEQKELESIIVNTKTQQQAILDNIPYLAWLKDKDGKYISANEPFANNFNLSVSELVGKTDYDICNKELANKYIQNDEEVKNSGTRQFVEEVRQTPEGSVWLETFKTPIFDSYGNIIGITGISRDITDRKRMEEVIVKNEEHFKALLQNSSDAITILNAKGEITFESSEKNKISDFLIDELLGTTIFDIVHPDDKENFEEFFAQLLNIPGKEFKKEYRSLHKNKKWIYVESIFSNQLENPSINGILVNSRDISDRKMAELKERVYQDNLVFLSNSALDLLGLSDLEHIYKYITEKLYNFLENAVIIFSSYQEMKDCFIIENISGIDPYTDQFERIIGRDPIGLNLPRDLSISNFDTAGSVITIQDENLNWNYTEINSKMFEEINTILKIHKIYNISLAHQNKLLGNITIITLNKSIIKFKHIIETFVHQVSVTLHRSLLEAELKRAKNKAEESDKLKTAFLANMSHEIRTPMNGILGFAEMLNDDSLSLGNRKKYLEIINNNGKMLVNLIDDIIDFAKIEAKQIKVAKQDFSLNTLLAQVHASFLSETLKKEKKHVKLRMRKAFTNESCFIRTDPNRLRQVLVNLIGNSFKFTSEGYIEFGYELRADNMLEFYVEDTGIGIAQDKLDIIFERFMQADSSRTRKYGGSGLGLAISKGFIELLGGSMWVESEYGKGSKFYFTLPYVPTRKVQTEEEGEKKLKDQYIWKDKTFLVAEDDTFSYKFLEGFLKQTQATVMHAEDGNKAVKLCKENPHIDLVLMDIQMPELNGIEATSIIKEFNKNLPIIAQTANAIPEEKERCIDAGCDDFITKPVNVVELYAKIEKLLIGNH